MKPRASVFNMQPIRVIFYGTSSFAVPILKRLLDDKRFAMVAVVTQPDRPAGRHAEPSISPIKQEALAAGLPIKQYEQVKSDAAFADLQTLDAEVAVVASFGQIMPERVLTLTPHGAINVHGSILPKYRGASPIAAAIKNGDTETGITIMKMDALMDHGPLLAIAKEPIRFDDTTTTLSGRLADLGAQTLPDVLASYCAGNITPTKQDHGAASRVPLLKREDGTIDWNRSAEEIERMVRAYDPWPGTSTVVDGKRLKILRASVTKMPEKNSLEGTRFIHEGKPAIVCGEGSALVLEQVQPEGKAAMDGASFIRGQRHWESV